MSYLCRCIFIFCIYFSWWGHKWCSDKCSSPSWRRCRSWRWTGSKKIFFLFFPHFVQFLVVFIITLSGALFLKFSKFWKRFDFGQFLSHFKLPTPKFDF
jgi:hypothetical protein